jgi:hypothetical protein
MLASPILGRIRANPAGKLFPASSPDRGDIGELCITSMNNSENVQRLRATNYFTIVVTI